MLKRFISIFLTSLLSLSLTLLCLPTSRGAEVAVSAESAILMCAEDNSVIFEKNAHVKMPMASTTKIMTCLIALEKGKLSQNIQIPKEAVGIEGSSLYLKEGDSLTLEALLYALMLRSANDCAAAIACHIGGSVDAFAELMNEKAAALGMKDTHFTNPHGLPDDEHYTTAYDFAVLTAYAMKDPNFAKIVSTVSYKLELNGGKEQRTVVNHNKLLRVYNGACGVKTGFTKSAGRCLVSCAERSGVRLIAVTLNAPNDWSDHAKMFDTGFSEYQRIDICKEGEIVRRLDVVGGGYVEISNRQALSLVAKTNSSPSIVINAPHLIFAPINEGDKVGEALIQIDEKTVAHLPLYANNSVSVPKQKSLIEKIGDFLLG